MAFTKEQVRTPVGIGDISAVLYDPDPTGTGVTAGTYSVQIVMSDGSVVVRSGDLADHTSPQQKTSHANFMANFRAKAIAELLPTP